jgi:hypothetical protein
MDRSRPQITHIQDWKPARKFPETYPGDRPPHSYLLLNDKVYPLQFDHPAELRMETETGGIVAVDETLKKLRLPLTKDRYAMLAYGGNRNPATLHIKFQNYGYRSPGEAWAVPMLRGKIHGADVVACGFSGQGYFYADLLQNSDWTRKTNAEAWLVLLDPDQLRAIHDSEGVRGGDYMVARFGGVTIDGYEKTLAPMGYAGKKPVLLSPPTQSPLGFKSVHAEGRAIPEMTPLQMLDHLLDAYGLREPICAATGLRHDADLAVELSKYMNGQWWYQFNTRQQPIRGYREVMRLFEEQIARHALPQSTTEQMRESGMALSTEEAYHPGHALTFGSLLG